MTREGLRDKEVGEQLVIDIARYGENVKLLYVLFMIKEVFEQSVWTYFRS